MISFLRNIFENISLRRLSKRHSSATSTIEGSIRQKGSPLAFQNGGAQSAKHQRRDQLIIIDRQ